MSDSEIIDDQNQTQRQKRRRISNELNEKALETIVFGRDTDIFDKISKKTKIEDKIGFIDDKDISDESSDESDEDIDRTETQFNFGNKSQTKNKSVWKDSDDDIDVSHAFRGATKLPKKVSKEDKYKDYLENKFNDLYKKPKWTQMTDKTSFSDDSDSSDGEDSDEDLKRTALKFKSKSNRLEKGFLAIKKCTDLTKNSKNKSQLNCVEFHPTSTVALVSSPKGTVKLFQVDGKINAKIQSIDFKDFKIEIAKFNKSGDELIVGSKRESGFYFYYDMMAGKIVRIPFIRGKEKYCLEKFVLSNDGKYIASKGKNGFINVLTAKSKEHVFDLKMNGEVMSLGFSDDSNLLISNGNAGKAYVWDIRKRQCINRFTDEGCVLGTAVSLSPNSKYCCTGSDMGVVNVYKMDDILSKSQPKPLKSFMNLTTEISHLKFNHSSELLLMLSNAKDNSIKCVHMKSLTVYSNFPYASKNYGRIYDSDISLNSGYLSFGTGGGTAHLFRLNHYSNY